MFKISKLTEVHISCKPDLSANLLQIGLLTIWGRLPITMI
jgi:hypothetical protein